VACIEELEGDSGQSLMIGEGERGSSMVVNKLKSGCIDDKERILRARGVRNSEKELWLRIMGLETAKGGGTEKKQVEKGKKQEGVSRTQKTGKKRKRST